MRRRVIGTSIKDFLAVYGFFQGSRNPSLYQDEGCVTLATANAAAARRRANMSLTIMMMSMTNRIVVMVRPRGFDALGVVGGFTSLILIGQVACGTVRSTFARPSFVDATEARVGGVN